MRITKLMLQFKIDYLNKIMNVPITRYKTYKIDNKFISNIGHYYYSNTSNGYRLEKIVNTSGGCTDISLIGSKSEIYNVVKSMIQGIEEYSYKHFGYMIK